MTLLADSPLGKTTVYKDLYDASLLFAIPRQAGRSELGLQRSLPFHGVDLWQGFEVSWLNLKGMPEMRAISVQVPANSEFIIESKSFKLYLYAFNQSAFLDEHSVEQTIKRDLESLVKADIQITLKSLDDYNPQFNDFEGYCLDDLDLVETSFQPSDRPLMSNNNQTDGELYCHLLQSNCPITQQPDWGSVAIRYRGRQIDPADLLRYIISLRESHEFHEQCIERIFMKIYTAINPSFLSVEGRYTRRGSLDINPYRSTGQELPRHNFRLFRQ